MLDQNTDRMWFVIGALVVGAGIILLANKTMPQLFASVADTFKEKTDEVTTVMDDMELHKSNYITDFTARSYHSLYSPSTKFIEDGSEYGNVVEITANPEDIAYGRATGIWVIPRKNLLIGESYTLSVYAKSNAPTMSFYLAIDDHQITNAKSFQINDEWQKIEATFVNSGVNTRPRFYTTDNGTYSVAQPRLYAVETGVK